MLGRLDRLSWRGAIVGPEGSGKTTLLEGLARQVGEHSVLLRLGGGRRPFDAAIDQLPRTVFPDDIILVDAAERLGVPGWLRFRHAVRAASGLIITAHRPGRLPTLVQCDTSTELLHELVLELAPDDASSLAPMLSDLFHRHDGNLRLCFRELYDVYAGRVTSERS